MRKHFKKFISIGLSFMLVFQPMALQVQTNHKSTNSIEISLSEPQALANTASPGEGRVDVVQERGGDITNLYKHLAKPDFEDMWKSIGIGMLSSVLTFGLGGAASGAIEGAELVVQIAVNVVVQAAIQGIIGGLEAAASGEDFWQGFAMGAIKGALSALAQGALDGVFEALEGLADGLEVFLKVVINAGTEGLTSFLVGGLEGCIFGEGWDSQAALRGLATGAAAGAARGLGRGLGDVGAFDGSEGLQKLVAGASGALLGGIVNGAVAEGSGFNWIAGAAGAAGGVFAGMAGVDSSKSNSDDAETDEDAPGPTDEPEGGSPSAPGTEPGTDSGRTPRTKFGKFVKGTGKGLRETMRGLGTVEINVLDVIDGVLPEAIGEISESLTHLRYDRKMAKERWDMRVAANEEKIQGDEEFNASIDKSSAREIEDRMYELNLRKQAAGQIARTVGKGITAVGLKGFRNTLKEKAAYIAAVNRIDQPTSADYRQYLEDATTDATNHAADDFEEIQKEYGVNPVAGVRDATGFRTAVRGLNRQLASGDITQSEYRGMVSNAVKIYNVNQNDLESAYHGQYTSQAKNRYQSEQRQYRASMNEAALNANGRRRADHNAETHAGEDYSSLTTGPGGYVMPERNRSAFREAVRNLDKGLGDTPLDSGPDQVSGDNYRDTVKELALEYGANESDLEWAYRNRYRSDAREIDRSNQRSTRRGSFNDMRDRSLNSASTLLNEEGTSVPEGTQADASSDTANSFDQAVQGQLNSLNGLDARTINLENLEASFNNAIETQIKSGTPISQDQLNNAYNQYYSALRGKQQEQVRLSKEQYTITAGGVARGTMRTLARELTPTIASAITSAAAYSSAMSSANTAMSERMLREQFVNGEISHDEYIEGTKSYELQTERMQFYASELSTSIGALTEYSTKALIDLPGNIRQAHKAPDTDYSQIMDVEEGSNIIEADLGSGEVVIDVENNTISFGAETGSTTLNLAEGEASRLQQEIANASTVPENGEASNVSINLNLTLADGQTQRTVTYNPKTQADHLESITDRQDQLTSKRSDMAELQNGVWVARDPQKQSEVDAISDGLDALSEQLAGYRNESQGTVYLQSADNIPLAINPASYFSMTSAGPGYEDIERGLNDLSPALGAAFKVIADRISGQREHLTKQYKEGYIDEADYLNQLEDLKGEATQEFSTLYAANIGAADTESHGSIENNFSNRESNYYALSSQIATAESEMEGLTGDARRAKRAEISDLKDQLDIAEDAMEMARNRLTISSTNLGSRENFVDMQGAMYSDIQDQATHNAQIAIRDNLRSRSSAGVITAAQAEALNGLDNYVDEFGENFDMVASDNQMINLHVGDNTYKIYTDELEHQGVSLVGFQDMVNIGQAQTGELEFNRGAGDVFRNLGRTAIAGVWNPGFLAGRAQSWTAHGIRRALYKNEASNIDDMDYNKPYKDALISFASGLTQSAVYNGLMIGSALNRHKGGSGQIAGMYINAKNMEDYYQDNVKPIMAKLDEKHFNRTVDRLNTMMGEFSDDQMADVQEYMTLLNAGNLNDNMETITALESFEHVQQFKKIFARYDITPQESEGEADLTAPVVSSGVSTPGAAAAQARARIAFGAGKSSGRGLSTTEYSTPSNIAVMNEVYSLAVKQRSPGHLAQFALSDAERRGATGDGTALNIEQIDANVGTTLSNNQRADFIAERLSKKYDNIPVQDIRTRVLNGAQEGDANNTDFIELNNDIGKVNPYVMSRMRSDSHIMKDAASSLEYQSFRRAGEGAREVGTGMGIFGRTMLQSMGKNFGKAVVGITAGLATQDFYTGSDTSSEAYQNTARLRAMNAMVIAPALHGIGANIHGIARTGAGYGGAFKRNLATEIDGLIGIADEEDATMNVYASIGRDLEDDPSRIDKMGPLGASLTQSAHHAMKDAAANIVRDYMDPGYMRANAMTRENFSTTVQAGGSSYGRMLARDEGYTQGVLDTEMNSQYTGFYATIPGVSTSMGLKDHYMMYRYDFDKEITAPEYILLDDANLNEVRNLVMAETEILKDLGIELDEVEAMEAGQLEALINTDIQKLRSSIDRRGYGEYGFSDVQKRHLVTSVLGERGGAVNYRLDNWDRTFSLIKQTLGHRYRNNNAGTAELGMGMVFSQVRDPGAEWRYENPRFVGNDPEINVDRVFDGDGFQAEYISFADMNSKKQFDEFTAREAMNVNNVDVTDWQQDTNADAYGNSGVVTSTESAVQTQSVTPTGISDRPATGFE